MNIKNIILVILLCLVGIEKASAQLDPTLAGMVIAFTDKAKKQYKTQLGTMALETEGHILLKAEVKSVADFQRQFEEYISSFRSVISYAAQTYGFYYEVGNLCDKMGKLSKEIGDAPTNAIAVALHGKRNDIYVNIINKSLGVVNTVRQVCLDKKMTEQQRLELAFSVRPQLQQMNRDLAMLTKLVHSTTMGQVWYDIQRKSVPHRDNKSDIIEECMGAWRVNARSVTPGN